MLENLFEPRAVELSGEVLGGQDPRGSSNRATSEDGTAATLRPKPLAFGEACDLDLTFAPTEATAHAVTLNISWMASTTSVLLLGEAQVPGSLVLSATGNGGGFGDVAIATSVSRAVVLTNPGQIPPGHHQRQQSLKDALAGAHRETGVKGTQAMLLTRAVQGAQIVGFVMTAVDLGTAANTSLRTSSVRPLAAEGIRQVGGWAAAWAGVKLGAAAGALIGIETGPGAVVSAAAGSITLGVAGYCGLDWAADFIYEN